MSQRQEGDLEVVLIAKVRELHRARELLAGAGIDCKHSRPKKSEGILRVAATDAARARALLAPDFGEAVVGAESAAFFRCPDCGSQLSGGQTVCAECGAFVGDPHGG